MAVARVHGAECIVKTGDSLIQVRRVKSLQRFFDGFSSETKEIGPGSR